MFWFEFRAADGSTYVLSSEGLTYGEREAQMSDPDFIREFQGDKFGKPFGAAKKG